MSVGAAVKPAAMVHIHERNRGAGTMHDNLKRMRRCVRLEMSTARGQSIDFCVRNLKSKQPKCILFLDVP